MVIGLDKFREQFAGEEDKYIIIGGTACDVNLRDTNTEARDTVDIDIILIVENMTADFGRKFWNFIEDGGYHNRSRKRGEGKGSVPEKGNTKLNTSSEFVSKKRAYLGNK